MAEQDKVFGPRVGQVVSVVRNGSSTYRVTSVEPGDDSCWTYTLEPVAGEPED